MVKDDINKINEEMINVMSKIEGLGESPENKSKVDKLEEKVILLLQTQILRVEKKRYLRNLMSRLRGSSDEGIIITTMDELQYLRNCELKTMDADNGFIQLEYVLLVEEKRLIDLENDMKKKAGNYYYIIIS